MKKTILALFVLGALSIGTVAQDQQPPVLDAILSTLTEIKTDIAVMKNDIVVIKTDIAVMKTDIAVMKNDIVWLKTDVAKLNTDVDGLTTSMIQVQTAQATNEKWIKVYGPVFLGILAGILGYFFINLRQKETHAIRSGSQPELTGIRPKQRTKTRPAT